MKVLFLVDWPLLHLLHPSVYFTLAEVCLPPASFTCQPTAPDKSSGDPGINLWFFQESQWVLTLIHFFLWGLVGLYWISTGPSSYWCFFLRWFLRPWSLASWLTWGLKEDFGSRGGRSRFDLLCLSLGLSRLGPCLGSIWLESSLPLVPCVSCACFSLKKKAFHRLPSSESIG